MSRFNYAVVVDDDHLDSTPAIAETMSQAGFHVDNVMADIGAIYGSADENTASKVRLIEGVEDVRPEGSVQLPPFDENVPQ